MRKLITLCTLALAVSFCRADLIVTQSTPKTVGNKSVVLLSLKNNFAETIQSARAVCFLLDDQGKMVGQSTKWVIGQNKTSLNRAASKKQIPISSFQLQPGVAAKPPCRIDYWFFAPKPEFACLMCKFPFL